MMTLFAVLIGVVGAVFLYLAAPAQHLLKCRLSNRICALSGTGWLSVSLFFHLMIYGSGTAVFALLTLLMVVWSVLPIGLALLKQGHKAP